MAEDTVKPIRIGISSCLLGENVRYNGDHKRDRYITDTLSRYFEFVPCCPEVAIGLGVPRPTIRLEGKPDQPRAVVQDDNRRDVTEPLREYGRNIAAAATDISGYILKSRSPSCGMERVKIYDHNNVPSASANGIFARALMENRPLLPVEEEGRLNDPDLRDNFLERVFIYSRWQNLVAESERVRDLVAFHTAHKFLIMAHDQNAMRAMGRMVARAAEDPARVMEEYFILLMQTVKKPVRRSNQINTLQHIAGFFKNDLDENDRRELGEAIEGYRTGELPVIVALTLIRHHLRRNPDGYLENQRFLESLPANLIAKPR
ncbi:MAG: DUF523 and DUF1722 domain-containing protein [Gammaproteobacteria bacterium]